MGHFEDIIWDTNYITDYIVVIATDAETLQERVQERIHNDLNDDDGWQPYGSIDVTLTYYAVYSREYCQPMVKYREMPQNLPLHQIVNQNIVIPIP